jgi:phospholipase/carboxylesterase
VALSGGRIRLGPCAASLLACLGCGADREPRAGVTAGEPETRLEARVEGRGRACAPGEHELKVARGRRVLMRVTRGGSGRRRAVLLALHGAGSGGAPGGLWAFRGAWEVPGLVIVAPAAAGSAWTLEARDVELVDRALQRAFDRCVVDPRRVVVGGFSSGAGMALWLGLTNGDLFRAVIALSPGSSLPSRRVGRPWVFVAHGTEDSVIPIGLGGDRVAAALRSDGYRVTYRRFAGGHRVRPAIARAAVARAVRDRRS